MNITFTFYTRSPKELAAAVAQACKTYLQVSPDQKKNLESRIKLVNQISNQHKVKFETMWSILFSEGYE